MDTYHATLYRVINGDTIETRVDLGFDVLVRATIQLRGINLPEPHEEGGQEARRITKGILEGDPHLKLARPERDGFGRWVCDVFVASGASLVDLIELRLGGQADG